MIQLNSNGNEKQVVLKMFQPEMVVENLLKKFQHCKSSSSSWNEQRTGNITKCAPSSYWSSMVTSNAYNTRPNPYNYVTRTNTMASPALPALVMGRIKQLVENFGELRLDHFAEVYRAQYDEELNPKTYNFETLEDALMNAKPSCFLSYNVYRKEYTVKRYKKYAGAPYNNLQIESVKKTKLSYESSVSDYANDHHMGTSQSNHYLIETRHLHTPPATSNSSESSPISCSSTSEKTNALESSIVSRDPRMFKVRKELLSQTVNIHSHRSVPSTSSPLHLLKQSESASSATKDSLTLKNASENSLEVVVYKKTRNSDANFESKNTSPSKSTSSNADSSQSELFKLDAICQSFNEFIKTETAKKSKESQKTITSPEKYTSTTSKRNFNITPETKTWLPIEEKSTKQWQQNSTVSSKLKAINPPDQRSEISRDEQTVISNQTRTTMPSRSETVTRSQQKLTNPLNPTGAMSSYKKPILILEPMMSKAAEAKSFAISRTRAIMAPEPDDYDTFDNIDKTASFQNKGQFPSFSLEVIKTIAEEHVAPITLERLCHEYRIKTGFTTPLLSPKLNEKQKLQSLKSLSGILQVIEANSAFNLTDQHLLMNLNRLKMYPMRKTMYNRNINTKTDNILPTDVFSKECRTELFGFLLSKKVPVLIADVLPLFYQFYTPLQIQKRGRQFSKCLLRLSKVMPIEIMYNGIEESVALISKYVDNFLVRAINGNELDIVKLYNLNSNIKVGTYQINEIEMETILTKSNDEWFSIKIGEVVDSNLVYIYSDENVQLEALMKQMQSDYNSIQQEQLMIPSTFITRGMYAVAKSSNGRWMRVQVLNAINGTDKALIESIDFGERKLVDHKDLRFILNGHEKLPAQAIRVRLAHIKLSDLISHENLKKSLLDYKLEQRSLLCHLLRNPKLELPNDSEMVCATSRAKYTVLLCEKPLNLDSVTVNEKFALKFMNDQPSTLKVIREQVISILSKKTPIRKPDPTNLPTRKSRIIKFMESSEKNQKSNNSSRTSSCESFNKFAEQQLEVALDRQIQKTKVKRIRKKIKTFVAVENEPIKIKCLSCIEEAGTLKMFKKRSVDTITVLRIRKKLYIQDSDITPLVKTTFWKFVSIANV